MARSGYIWGGLLQGLGSGVAMHAAQMRENALEALRNQRGIEAEGRAEQTAIRAEDRAEGRAIDADERDSLVKVGLLDLAQRYKREEWETQHQYETRLLQIKGEIESGHIRERGGETRKTEEVRFNHDVKLANINASLDRQNDRAAQLLKQQIERGEREVVGVTPEGFIIVKTGSGTLITTKTKMAASELGGGEGETGGAIAAAAARRGGGGKPTPTPSAAAKPASSADSATAIERALNEGVKNGSVPKGEFEGDVIEHPGGGRAEWIKGKWVLFKEPAPVRDRGF